MGTGCDGKQKLAVRSFWLVRYGNQEQQQPSLSRAAQATWARAWPDQTRPDGTYEASKLDQLGPPARRCVHVDGLLASLVAMRRVRALSRSSRRARPARLPPPPPLRCVIRLFPILASRLG